MSYTSRKTPRESGEITQVAGFFGIEEIAEESESSNIRECLSLGGFFMDYRFQIVELKGFILDSTWITLRSLSRRVHLAKI